MHNLFLFLFIAAQKIHNHFDAYICFDIVLLTIVQIQFYFNKNIQLNDILLSMTFNYQKVSAHRCCLCPISPENLPSYPLFRCQNCKLISYCGREHQKKHWTVHKHFCKSIQSIMDEWKLEHVLDINGHIVQLTVQQVRETKLMIQAMMVIKLGRDLTEHERELLWFPRICNVCNSYEGSLKSCPNCFSVCYCGDEHRVDDIEHSLICSKLHLCYNFSLGKVREDCSFSYSQS